MISYYTVLIMLCLLALGVLCILVQENSWISKPDKLRFYLTYGIIALSALAEWGGIQLSGNSRFPGWLLLAVKCADYILTPMVGGAFVGQMKLNDRWSKSLVFVLAANAVFQVLACFQHWMIVIDDQNHYTHGPLYPVYIALYLLVIVLVAIEFTIYGRSYRKQNKASLYSVLLLVIVGIAMQELIGKGYRTAYVAITMGTALMFIHYSEFYQMKTDERIMKDTLSRLYSRHAYTKALKDYQEAKALPGDLAIFTIDINGLKAVNDTLGHDAGDELITGAARCIEAVIGNTGKCFRTGGDEFIIMAHMSKEQADAALASLEQTAGSWRGKSVGSLSLSAGYALSCEHDDLPIEKLVQIADKAMYAAKAEYYQKSGHDRRSPK